jgi:hypothetical protein
MRRPARPLVAFFALLAAASSGSATAAQNAAAPCQPAGPLVRLPGLPESSGLAVSRRTPGRLWTHNDSGGPVLFALDAGGAVTGRVRLTGADVQDWEAIAAGPCGTGACLYVADIGDNAARRRRVTIYRLPEPAAACSSPAKAAGAASPGRSRASPA